MPEPNPPALSRRARRVIASAPCWRHTRRASPRPTVAALSVLSPAAVPLAACAGMLAVALSAGHGLLAVRVVAGGGVLLSLGAIGTILLLAHSGVTDTDRGMRRLTVDTAPLAMAVVREVAGLANLPVPELIRVRNAEFPNAGAASITRRQSMLVLVGGLFYDLTPRAQRGVVAHELAHIRHGDFLRVLMFDGLLVVAAPTGVLMAGVPPLWIAALAPVWGGMVAVLRSAWSRVAEYAADRRAAEWVGADAIATGLRESSAVLREAQRRMVLPWWGRPIRRLFRSRWFSSHPPTLARLARLRSSRPGCSPALAVLLSQEGA